MVEQSRSAPSGQRKFSIVAAQGQSRSLLFTRIGTSTSTLVREILPSQPDNVIADLASLYSITTKGDPSSGVSGPSASSSRHADGRHSAQGDVKPPTHRDSFRTQSSEVSGLAEVDFNSFLAKAETGLNGIPPDYGFCNDLSCRNGKQKSSQVHDGAAVVELLSDPNYTIEDLSDSCMQGSTNNFPSLWSTNAASTKLLDRIKAELPSMPIHRSPSPTSCWNLLPDFDSQGIPLIQTDMDVGPWLDVLINYQDNVWGELLPLVEEAHEELRAVLTGSGTNLNNCLAVRRLGLILGHLHTPTVTSQIVQL